MNTGHKTELTRFTNALIESGVKHDGDYWQAYTIGNDVYDINIYETDKGLRATAYPVVDNYIDTSNGVKLNITKGK